MPENLTRKLAPWRSLLAHLSAHLEELPNLAADHAELAGLVAEAQELEELQQVCEARLREVNRRRYDLVVRGCKLRNRLTAGLQSAFGLESDRLIAFGVKPRPKVVRRERLSKQQRARQAALATAMPAASEGV